MKALAHQASEQNVTSPDATDEKNNIHKTCLNTLLDNKIIWLQYRIPHNIIETKALLQTIKVN